MLFCCAAPFQALAAAAAAAGLPVAINYFPQDIFDAGVLRCIASSQLFAQFKLAAQDYPADCARNPWVMQPH
jgi:hypothetical protein